jgi:acyl-CoA reductase-like NAD-dependent aldehyde dehydrogenase
VNGVVPALLAGNCVILKHSQQTPLCAERIQQAFEKAGLPEGVLQVLHASHSVCDYIIKHPLCSFVNFTGSVSGGRSIQQSASSKFIGMHPFDSI